MALLDGTRMLDISSPAMEQTLSEANNILPTPARNDICPLSCTKMLVLYCWCVGANKGKMTACNNENAQECGFTFVVSQGSTQD